MMIIFIQSYASPSIMSADYGVYKRINNYFTNQLETLNLYDENVRDLTLKESLKQAYKAVMISSQNDILFGWGGDVTLFCWYISKLIRRKRRIIGQNLIINPTSFRTNRKQLIRGWLYKQALKDPFFKMTVNAEPLKEYYANTFNCSKDKFSVVHDAMALNDNDKVLLSQQNTQPYVFCGGKEQRDVDCFLRIVDRLPQINFRAVFQEKMIPVDFKPRKNLQILLDISTESFYEILCNAKVCCIPLKAVTPCGLFVMQKAMLMNIPIVSTETPSMRTIIPNDSFGYLHLMGDDEYMANSIEKLMNKESLRHSLIIKAKEHIEKEFSPSLISKQLCSAIEQFKSSMISKNNI